MSQLDLLHDLIARARAAGADAADAVLVAHRSHSPAVKDFVGTLAPSNVGHNQARRTFVAERAARAPAADLDD